MHQLKPDRNYAVRLRARAEQHQIEIEADGAAPLSCLEHRNREALRAWRARMEEARGTDGSALAR